MALTHFFVDTATGNDLNPGIGGPGSSATTPGTNDYTSAAGDFDGTSIFTPADGSNPSTFITVGDWVSLYNTGDAAVRCLAKVTAVVNATNGNVTIDTVNKFGTVPTASAGAHTRNLKHGGAWASLGITAANAAMNTGTAPLSIQVNIKAGTYANTTTSRTLGIAGTATIAVIWSGYKAVINDQDTNLLAVAATDIPTFTSTTGLFTPSTHNVLKNLDFNGSPPGNLLSGTTITTFVNCRATNTSANAAALAFRNGALTSVSFIACYAKCPSTATSCTLFSTAIATMAGCYIGGGITGLSCSSGAYVYGCVFDSQNGDAISGSVLIQSINNSFYGTTLGGLVPGNGINFVAETSSSIVMNCYFEGFNTAAKAAINNTSGTNTDLIRVVGCAYYNCTTPNQLGLGDFPVFFDKGTLASSGFNNAAADDFTPTAVLRNIGFPANIPTFTPINYPTPGAMDAQSGTGGGLLVNPRKTGGKQ